MRDDPRSRLETFNAVAPSRVVETLPELVESQAARTPDASAIVFGERSLNYAELNERSNRLAHLLLKHQVGSEDLVGVFLERSPELLVALLGVLKSGAAYLPLDPEHPRARLASILEDACPPWIITSEELRSLLPEGSATSLSLDGADTISLLAASPAHNPRNAERLRPLLTAHPAYAIYTSGSTGKPKGVVVSHSALSSFVGGIAGQVRFAPCDRHLAVTTVTFDISILELLVPLVYGSTILLVGTEDSRNPERLYELIRALNPSSIQGTPSHWQMLLDYAPNCVKAVRVLCGGEPLSGHMAS